MVSKRIRKRIDGAARSRVPQCWAIILAGGSGKRLGMDRPKAFVPLAGRPLLAWSMLTFARHKAITDVLVVVPSGWREEYSRSVLHPLEKELGDLAVKIREPVTGGRRRQESAQAGIEAALNQTRDKYAEETPILIHDAARPIVRSEVISELLASLDTAYQSGPGVAGVVPVLSMADTLKTVKGEIEVVGELTSGQVLRTVPRDDLWRVQTPQAFRLGPALEAHQHAVVADYHVTDDAMLFEWMGWPVKAIAGSPLTMKITHPEELSLLEGWLSIRPETSMPRRHGDRRHRAASREVATAGMARTSAGRVMTVRQRAAKAAGRQTRTDARQTRTDARQTRIGGQRLQVGAKQARTARRQGKATAR